MNEAHYPSTIVLPTTTHVVETESPLRLRLPAGTGGVEREADVLVGQVIAVADESFRKELGVLPDETLPRVLAALRLDAASGARDRGPSASRTARTRRFVCV